ncbi:hypothetical protein D3C87_1773180 [compost metagenome]
MSILHDFSFTEHKEKKVSDENPLPLKSAPLRTPQTNFEILKSHGELLGILGPCGLRGHIAHFYNLSLEIEKHIKTEAELSEPFLKAYHYLQAHPQIELIFVYTSKMIAAHSMNGRLQKSVI